MVHFSVIICCTAMNELTASYWLLISIAFSYLEIIQGQIEKQEGNLMCCAMCVLNVFDVIQR